jgi:hypothetical protein
MGRNECVAKCHGASFDGASCPWGEIQWDELSRNHFITLADREPPLYIRGLYIGKYAPPPPPGEGEYQSMSFGGKNMKRQREKGRKCKRKRKKGERKRKKGEEKGRQGKKMRKGEVKG